MIPQPKHVSLQTGFLQLPCLFRLQSKTLSQVLQAHYGNYLNNYQNQLTNGQSVSNPKTEIPFVMELADTGIDNPESYQLSISPTAITINAKTETGLCHAYQSLLQLIYIALKHQEGKLRCKSITDYPIYTYRGLHLDVSRHFFAVDFILELLNWMEALKLNKFHWHLSDDQGWRIESKRYPLLTGIGAWRKESDGSLYGGFYTQEEIRKVVSYAATMGIEVIPEIDLPGHAMAILAAYPSLACFPKQFETLNVWGISQDILCAGKPETLVFLQNLLEEVADLFPGQFFHIGGDEAPKQRWQKCPHCQARIKAQKLSGEEALQGWLIAELQKSLEQQGKTLIGWDEILEGSISAKPVAMVWRGDGRDAVNLAIQNGNRFILCPNHYFYFDWKQTHNEAEQGFHGVSTLENVYSFNPQALASQNPSLLLGMQANLWTEYMHNPTELKYMLFPRAYALAELAWGKSGADFGDFEQRIAELEGYL